MWQMPLRWSLEWLMHVGYKHLAPNGANFIKQAHKKI